MWAFGYGPHEATQIWDKIPLDTDIVITHTPPKYHCDERKDRRAAGCGALREVLWRVRPRMAICGHVHEGRGVERIRWDLDISNIKYKESGVERWEDPGKGNKKMSLLDLTIAGGNSLENDGSIGDWCKGVELKQNPVTSTGSVELPTGLENLQWKFKNKKPTAKLGLSHVTKNLLAVPAPSLPPATRGQGGLPPSQRCDLEALSGRLGRQETCIINAAIMESSWPRNGKKFNKPIVVDIDLPVWED